MLKNSKACVPSWIALFLAEASHAHMPAPCVQWLQSQPMSMLVWLQSQAHAHVILLFGSRSIPCPCWCGCEANGRCLGMYLCVHTSRDVGLSLSPSESRTMSSFLSPYILNAAKVCKALSIPASCGPCFPSFRPAKVSGWWQETGMSTAKSCRAPLSASRSRGHGCALGSPLC